MYYPCGKFGDSSFSHFGFIVQINRQTQIHTDAAERLISATVSWLRIKKKQSTLKQLVLMALITRNESSFHQHNEPISEYTK